MGPGGKGTLGESSLKGLAFLCGYVLVILVNLALKKKSCRAKKMQKGA